MTQLHGERGEILKDVIGLYIPLLGFMIGMLLLSFFVLKNSEQYVPPTEKEWCEHNSVFPVQRLPAYCLKHLN